MVPAVFRLNLGKHEEERVGFGELKGRGFRFERGQVRRVVGCKVGEVDGGEAEAIFGRVGCESGEDQLWELVD